MEDDDEGGASSVAWRGSAARREAGRRRGGETGVAPGRRVGRGEEAWRRGWPPTARPWRPSPGVASRRCPLRRRARAPSTNPDAGRGPDAVRLHDEGGARARGSKRIEGVGAPPELATRRRAVGQQVGDGAGGGGVACGGGGGAVPVIRGRATPSA